jgi:hypothetical protein
MGKSRRTDKCANASSDPAKHARRWKEQRSLDWAYTRQRRHNNRQLNASPIQASSKSSHFLQDIPRQNLP